MNIFTLINSNNEAFLRLCVQHQVATMYAFGSSVADRFDPVNSDIDLVVELSIEDPLDYGDALLSLWDKLEVFFKRKVDLLTPDSIKNPYLKKSIESTKKLIYDGQNILHGN